MQNSQPRRLVRSAQAPTADVTLGLRMVEEPARGAEPALLRLTTIVESSPAASLDDPPNKELPK